MKRALLFATSLLLVACSGGSSASNRTPKGSPNAAVVVEEYADLQCPACRAAHEGVVRQMIAAYGNRIRFDFKHFPLRSIHRYALDAAEASECAADQGKFWEYVDAVFQNQQDLSRDTLSSWAVSIGLDSSLFEDCWKAHSKRGTVLQDYEQGRELGVNGTPTFFVNGKQVQTGFDTLSDAIDAELKRLTQRL